MGVQFQLEGSFLEEARDFHEKHIDHWLHKADVIFCINVKWAPSTNCTLSGMLAEYMRDGAKVICIEESLEAYLKQHVGFNLKPVKCEQGSVSWSDTPGRYSIATIRHDLLSETGRTSRRGD